MSTNSIESTSKSDRKWNDVQNMIGELVAERHEHAPVAGEHAATAGRHAILDGAGYASRATAGSIEDDLEADQFARDIAEIERAAAALRAGEPDLEPWMTGTTAAPEHRQPRSVWLFVGTIWITTVLVTGAATLAITSLL
jgi:hypothetical protein